MLEEDTCKIHGYGLAPSADIAANYSDLATRRDAMSLTGAFVSSYSDHSDSVSSVGCLMDQG